MTSRNTCYPKSASAPASLLRQALVRFGLLPIDTRISASRTVARGDTSGKALKPARISMDFEIQVPAFCETGDMVEIDTRTHEYRRHVND